MGSLLSVMFGESDEDGVTAEKKTDAAPWGFDIALNKMHCTMSRDEKHGAILGRFRVFARVPGESVCQELWRSAIHKPRMIDSLRHCGPSTE